MNKENLTYYADNRVGSDYHCECGQKLTQTEYNNARQYQHKMCSKCMNNYCDHAMTGD